ncbi:hypothetical protein TNCV_419131 [Trichonephila clavipes]|uniref:Uncharacterized protein n=1 Tax=Trichonephila clavipes TaxID=2585209 RepID=A0A8X6V4P0_TRICX|nr:hypothetical protein TNCV_419131 [Trichonephila clavipes]
MILCVAEYWKERRRVKNFAREFDIAHSVVSRLGSHLKLLECVVDGTGEVVFEKYDACRRQIYRPISKKGTGAPQLSANQFLAASGKQISKNCLPDV